MARQVAGVLVRSLSQIFAVCMDNAADDAGQAPALLGQIEGEIASVTADGAYDGEPVYQAVARH
jgi:hypothetical protein